MIIKPFQQQSRYTTMDNFIIDHVMPGLSGSAWKVLTIIVRKTIGWHKEQDEVSFRQLLTLTGIKSFATLTNALKELEDKKIIMVDRGDGKGITFIYALNLDFELEIKEGVTESVTEVGVTETVTPTVTESVTLLKKGVTESVTTKERKNLNKESKEKDSALSDSRIDKPKKPEAKATTESPAREMFSALANLCRFDLKLITDKIRGQLNQAEKKLRAAGHDPAQVEAFGAWWYKNDWRGKQDQPPTIAQVLENWGQFEKRSLNGAKNPTAKLDPANPDDWRKMLDSVA